MEVLKGYEGRIKSGEISLGDLATSESDCSSARKKGDLWVLSFFFCHLFFLSGICCFVIRRGATADGAFQGDSLVTGTCRRSLSRRLLLSSLGRLVELSIRLAGCI